MNKALYLRVNVLNTKVLIGDNIYIYIFTWEYHFTCSSELHKGLAVSRAKAIPSVVSYTHV